MKTLYWHAGPGGAEPVGPVYDRLGSQWHRSREDGWHLTGSPFALRWTSPAMQAAGPFTDGPQRR